MLDSFQYLILRLQLALVDLEFLDDRFRRFIFEFRRRILTLAEFLLRNMPQSAFAVLILV